MASFISDYGIRKFKKAKKLHFKLKLEAGTTVLIEAGSQIQAGSRIKAGGLTALF